MKLSDIVPSVETCLKLQELKFGNTIFARGRSKKFDIVDVGETFSICRTEHKKNNPTIHFGLPAPTTEELLARIPKIITRTIYSEEEERNVNMIYTFSIDYGEGEVVLEDYSYSKILINIPIKENLVEALALFWIELKNKGYEV